ncbi:MAG TPA: DUF370 domain-containing protein [Dehalococcoidia bacterium]|jgi:regulator of extracellular matrix RemA (YlzA/DUF370 family)|nr:DUF370 domain-containing protein [Dehalococcoidia bacterium]
MPTELIHIGFGNYIAADHVVGIAAPGSAPVKRLVQEGRDKSTTIDMTSGRRTKAVVFMDNGSIMLAAITPETIEGRVRMQRGGARPTQMTESTTSP